MISVTKGASQRGLFRRQMIFFPSGRAAFLAYMQAVSVTAEQKILLPAYIGWSSREGSGVYDPVAQVGATPVFYKVSSDLHIDIDDAKSKMIETSPDIVVLIHYFGFPDPNARCLAEFARNAGIRVLEDEAHALLSDLTTGACGRWGDAAIFSFHKLLPLKEGGALVLNAAHPQEVIDLIASHPQAVASSDFCNYDLVSIAKKRVCNAETLLELLEKHAVPVSALRSSIPKGVVPQTLPVIVPAAVRDSLYFQMNEKGFGVVSLYHSLIDLLPAQSYPASHVLSKTILNLPVHQDVDAGGLEALTISLKRLLSSLSEH